MIRHTFVRLLTVLVVGLVSCLTVFGATIGANATLIKIPWLGTGPLQADPYPSTITIAGVVNPVSSVTVTLFGYNHTYSPDVDILLIGPTGLSLLMMSDAGGTYEGPVNLTFSDAAAGLLPQNGPFVSGTYKPTNYNDNMGTDIFEAPAPAGPYGTTLSVFNGSNANGNWQLWVRDDTHIDDGSITGGWQLNISDDLGVPEPSTVALVLAGIAAVIAGRRRRTIR